MAGSKSIHMKSNQLCSCPQLIISDPSFPHNPETAIKRGFEETEQKFLSQSQCRTERKLLDKSGSCALIALIIGNTCYVANVGDSRAVISM